MTDGRVVLETGWIIKAWIDKTPLLGENELEHQFENCNKSAETPLSPCREKPNLNFHNSFYTVFTDLQV